MIRIDKYLWAVRLFKTRTQASEACKSQKVLINHEPVKSSREVKKGDVISLKKNTAIFSFRIIELLENRVGAPLVKDYLEDITPIDQVEKQKEYLHAKKEFRDFTLGKPSKTDRRKLRNFLGD
ncbi:MAG: RNA-binding S4 domain-containing protein [Crocinitomicaceae bacterium]|jgi:ribosome-associated heat shock protein Hsp15|nr:RNA-binding S4 domain-containing protein [Crocinitomicaceae bacterium]MBK6951694.1 RNA-binding S4 domain-containing protein [Crocinitomicaceae bacterium]MBK9593557.1 RNA-binding S4 domain-containing protein [Crocinitomicaceae bacterium]